MRLRPTSGGPSLARKSRVERRSISCSSEKAKSTRVSAPKRDARFAASAAGAKERVALGGAHPFMRDDHEPGPSTQASAPWAPGRPGRPDANSFGGGALWLRKCKTGRQAGGDGAPAPPLPPPPLVFLHA